jgi:DNA-binding NarL/FixJ family response regulator
MNKKIRIAYIEDLKIVREGVNYLLSQNKHFEVIDTEFDWNKIEEFISRNKLDVLIVDLQLQVPKEMDPMDGFSVCELVTSKFPFVKCIAHSMYDSVENVNKFFRKGGMAFVSKKSGHVELISAIEHVSRGKKYVCKEVAKQTKNSARFLNLEDEQLKANNELFTKAEKSVLEKIAKGYSTKQIAHQLEISEKTVETHRKHLFDKAGVKNVAELIAFVYSRRIVMD